MVKGQQRFDSKNNSEQRPNHNEGIKKRCITAPKKNGGGSAKIILNKLNMIKYNYKSWNSFTAIKALIKYEDDILMCSRVFNKNWKNAQYNEAFKDETFKTESIWINNMSIDGTRLSDLNVEYKRVSQNLYITTFMALGLFAFSHFTNSLFIWNGLIYVLLIVFGLVIYFIGQTIFSFSVESNGKKYSFDCRSMGNDIGLVKFVEELKKEIG